MLSLKSLDCVYFSKYCSEMLCRERIIFYNKYKYCSLSISNHKYHTALMNPTLEEQLRIIVKNKFSV